jgi:hypothetical protein
MYNLASILKSVINELDVDRCKDLVALKHEASGMKSLHTGSAWQTGTAEGSKRGRMDTILEEGRGSERENEEELGVFDDPVIHAALNKMNYKVGWVAPTVCVL